MMWFGKRGLVVKISDGYCVVLTGKGTYERIPVPRQGARVGAEVSYSYQAVSSPIFKPMALVASFLLLFVCYSLFNQSSLPVAVAYVSLDINPSLELSVDKNLDVIGVKYFNDDAANLLKQERLQGKNLYEALGVVVEQAIAKNYIKTGQENLIVSTVTPSGTSSSSAGPPCIAQQSIQQFLEKSINQGGLTGEVRTYSATGEFRTEAESNGLSPGKYLIYRQLNETGSRVSLDDVRKNNIRNLVDTYKLSLLPNFENIRIQRQQNGAEPDITVDDNGRAVSIADFFNEHEGNGVAPLQTAITGQGVQPGRSIRSTRITAPGKNQTGSKVTQQKKERGTSGGKIQKRRHGVAGTPTSISTDGIPWDSWYLQQNP
jgi:uncharacterized membrane protein